MAKKPTLSQEIDASLKATEAWLAHNNGQSAKPRRGKPLVWEGDSECFDDLRYSPSAGGVYATFNDGSQYFYGMSRAEAKSWFNSDVGRTFNKEIK
jgi:hypothetical protein